ncbi:MAG: DNA gyrase inhibitor YacG [Gammaproteobacteria bacterium]
MTQKCPSCRKMSGHPSTNYSYPFCCERCRLIDLGKWLDEKNYIPGSESESTESTPANNMNIVKH